MYILSKLAMSFGGLSFFNWWSVLLSNIPELPNPHATLHSVAMAHKSRINRKDLFSIVS